MDTAGVWRVGATVGAWRHWRQQASHKDSTDSDIVLQPDNRDKYAASGLSA